MEINVIYQCTFFTFLPEKIKETHIDCDHLIITTAALLFFKIIIIIVLTLIIICSYRSHKNFLASFLGTGSEQEKLQKPMGDVVV